MKNKKDRLAGVKVGDNVLFSDKVIRVVRGIDDGFMGNIVKYKPGISVYYISCSRWFNIDDGIHMSNAVPVKAMRIATDKDMEKYKVGD